MLKRIRRLFKKTTAEPNETSPIPAASPPGAAVVVHRGPTIVHHPIPERELDPDAVRIVRRLARFDHTAYLVGGCVRDLLLDRRPKDFDIGTSATPRTVKRAFSNCRIIGRRFRLAHVYFQSGKFIEVATFRARDVRDPEENGAPSGDEEEKDLLIRDDNVFGTPEEDALRRDFTINQLFYDVGSGNVLDHADGLGDLRRRLVRTIGDPDVRFREDPIRVLRAVKFAARLDFHIEPRTLAALERTRSELPKSAPPRVLEEIHRFCRGGASRRSFELLFTTRVFEVILPELAAVYEDPASRAMLMALLSRIDERSRGAEISSGEIFAALVLPAVVDSFGWKVDGSFAPPARRVDGRAVAEQVLRPIALRLRIARRDQERCRQALATIQRMVPHRALRRGARGAISRRPAYGDALWMLEAIALIRGGELASSLDGWLGRVDDAAHAVQASPAAPTAEVAASEPAGPSRRRRRRRGGRGRSGPGPRVEAPAAAAPPAPAARPLPPKWSDDYFFAALPTVPSDVALESDDRDRYGASLVAPIGATRAPVGSESTDTAEARPRRRRRRGGRGRGGRGSTPTEAAPSSGADGE